MADTHGIQDITLGNDTHRMSACISDHNAGKTALRHDTGSLADAGISEETSDITRGDVDQLVRIFVVHALPTH
jgi:hypothetical protein